MEGMLGGPSKPRGRTVVIVEDAESCAVTLEVAFLSIPDVTVLQAPTAQQALQILQAHGGDIAAVVTDLNMPRMDGYELIARLRADRRFARLPVIVVSGDTDPRTPERIKRLGADAYFPKPYSPAQVRDKLEQLLNANSSQPH